MILMRRCTRRGLILGAFVLFSTFAAVALGAAPGSGADVGPAFPPPLESYNDAHLTSLWDILRNRVEKQPFNLWATLLFFGAIIHTFLTHRLRHIAHVLEHRHQEKIRLAVTSGQTKGVRQVSASARMFHFLGEVEAVFGIWIIPLLFLMNAFVGRSTMINYVSHHVNFVEPVFVIVVMAIAATRPILQLAEQALRWLARLGGETPVALWLTILTAGALLGSFITEPAAMTIVCPIAFFAENSTRSSRVALSPTQR